jgi:hypothetical protein
MCTSRLSICLNCNVHDAAELLAPKELRERLREIAQKLADLLT